MKGHFQNYEYADSIENFVNVITSKYTEKSYKHSLKSYIKFYDIENYDDLLQIDKDTTFKMIRDYIVYLRKIKQRSYSRVNNAFCAIRLFYSVNRYDDLNWFTLARFKGKERRRMVNDRSYTREEIHKILDYADLRMKVAILVMVSSGVRVGGLVSIKIKDLEYIDEYKLYRIFIYSEDIDDTYYTFCTPEAAQYIQLYLETRKRQGENITPDSPLIRKDFDNTMNISLNPHSITERIRVIIIRSGIRKNQKIEQGQDPIEVRRKRTEIMACHAFRKFFDTICVESDMKHLAKEILIGHKKEQGLDRSYYRPKSYDKLLVEYLKVVNDLTINDENRLRFENQELHKQLENDFAPLKSKIARLEEKFKEMGI